jgi:hypothetical protein
LSSYAQDAFSLATSMHHKGKSDAEINATLQEYAKGDHQEGQDLCHRLANSIGSSTFNYR